MLLAGLQNVRKEFASHTVLTDVTCKISSGQKLGLIGANGSGKTTLIKIIMGAESATGGVVQLAKDIRIGDVPQHVEVTGGSDGSGIRAGSLRGDFSHS